MLRLFFSFVNCAIAATVRPAAPAAGTPGAEALVRPEPVERPQVVISATGQTEALVRPEPAAERPEFAISSVGQSEAGVRGEHGFVEVSAAARSRAASEHALTHGQRCGQRTGRVLDGSVVVPYAEPGYCCASRDSQRLTLGPLGEDLTDATCAKKKCCGEAFAIPNPRLRIEPKYGLPRVLNRFGFYPTFALGAPLTDGDFLTLSKPKDGPKEVDILENEVRWLWAITTAEAPFDLADVVYREGRGPNHLVATGTLPFGGELREVTVTLNEGVVYTLTLRGGTVSGISSGSDDDLTFVKLTEKVMLTVEERAIVSWKSAGKGKRKTYSPLAKKTETLKIRNGDTLEVRPVYNDALHVFNAGQLAAVAAGNMGAVEFGTEYRLHVQLVTAGRDEAEPWDEPPVPRGVRQHVGFRLPELTAGLAAASKPDGPDRCTILASWGLEDYRIDYGDGKVEPVPFGGSIYRTLAGGLEAEAEQAYRELVVAVDAGVPGLGGLRDAALVAALVDLFASPTVARSQMKQQLSFFGQAGQKVIDSDVTGVPLRIGRAYHVYWFLFAPSRAPVLGRLNAETPLGKLAAPSLRRFVMTANPDETTNPDEVVFRRGLKAVQLSDNWPERKRSDSSERKKMQAVVFDRNANVFLQAQTKLQDGSVQDVFSVRDARGQVHTTRRPVPVLFKKWAQDGVWFRFASDHDDASGGDDWGGVKKDLATRLGEDAAKPEAGVLEIACSDDPAACETAPTYRPILAPGGFIEGLTFLPKPTEEPAQVAKLQFLGMALARLYVLDQDAGSHFLTAKLSPHVYEALSRGAVEPQAVVDVKATSLEESAKLQAARYPQEFVIPECEMVVDLLGKRDMGTMGIYGRTYQNEDLAAAEIGTEQYVTPLYQDPRTLSSDLLYDTFEDADWWPKPEAGLAGDHESSGLSGDSSNGYGFVELSARGGPCDGLDALEDAEQLSRCNHLNLPKTRKYFKDLLRTKCAAWLRDHFGKPMQFVREGWDYALAGLRQRPLPKDRSPDADDPTYDPTYREVLSRGSTPGVLRAARLTAGAATLRRLVEAAPLDKGLVQALVAEDCMTIYEPRCVGDGCNSRVADAAFGRAGRPKIRERLAAILDRVQERGKLDSVLYFWLGTRSIGADGPKALSYGLGSALEGRLRGVELVLVQPPDRRGTPAYCPGTITAVTCSNRLTLGYWCVMGASVEEAVEALLFAAENTGGFQNA